MAGFALYFPLALSLFCYKNVSSIFVRMGFIVYNIVESMCADTVYPEIKSFYICTDIMQNKKLEVYFFWENFKIKCKSFL